MIFPRSDMTRGNSLPSASAHAAQSVTSDAPRRAPVLHLTVIIDFSPGKSLLLEISGTLQAQFSEIPRMFTVFREALTRVNEPFTSWRWCSAPRSRTGFSQNRQSGIWGLATQKAPDAAPM